MKFHEIQRGGKTLYVIIDGEKASVYVDCQVFPDSTVGIHLNLNEFEKIVNRTGPIQEVAPSLKPELREVFISGTTPAEWDEMFGNLKKYEEYKQLGYFDDYD